jgi:hypothetical protein
MGLKEARIWQGRCRWCLRFCWRPRGHRCWPQRSNRLGQRTVVGGNGLVIIRGGSLVLSAVLSAAVGDDEAAKGDKKHQNGSSRV